MKRFETAGRPSGGAAALGIHTGPLHRRSYSQSAAGPVLSHFEAPSLSQDREPGPSQVEAPALSHAEAPALSHAQAPALSHAEAPPTGIARPALAFGELSARMVIVALFTFMAMRIGADFIQTGRVTGLLLVASEALVVVLTVFRRPAQVVDRSLRARIVTTLSLIGPSLVMPAAVVALLPAVVTVTVSACGLLVVICGKLSLGRSFGLMPANRGVVSTGLYRLVRHPIYLGYLITHAGFLAANPTVWNVMTLGGADVVLLIRAVCEERTLARDVSYRAYQAQVPWRVLPGVF